MFYCDYCNHISRSGEKLHLVTTAVRQKTYRNSYRPTRDELEEVDYMPRSEESAGTEIVHQAKACERCAHKHKDVPPQVVKDDRPNNVVWESKSKPRNSRK